MVRFGMTTSIKNIFLCVLFALFCTACGGGEEPVITPEQTLAFPRAEGGGKYATGGRGGNVYYVTRLDDCSDDNLVEGTLRWALRSGDDTPRTVLFQVCGTIYLNTKLKLAHPNIHHCRTNCPGRWHLHRGREHIYV